LYIMVLVIGLFAYMQGVMLYVVRHAVAKEQALDIGRAFIAAMFLFFGLLGNVMGKVRKNFYIGVRVPWTLASDRVSNDTPRLAACRWFAAGAIGFLMIALGAPWIPAMALLLIAALAPIIYSFVHYKNLEHSGELTIKGSGTDSAIDPGEF